MLLITQNTENLFAREFSNCLQHQTSTRCIVLKLSQVPHKPADWPQRTTEVIEKCLGSDGRVFFYENGDVTILVRTATQKHFTRFVGLLTARLATAPLHGLAFLYELPADGEIVANLFTGTEKLRMEPVNTVGGRTEGVNVAKDHLNRNLSRTISLRRERRTVPEILLVEDDVFLQRLVSNLFVKNFRVTVARSGADALDLYIQSAPDIVFLNIGLPDISGFEVLVSILELDPDAYIVVLSGQGNRDNVLRSIDLGAKSFVGKPFTSDKLFSCVGKCSFVQEKRMKAALRKSTFRRHRPGVDRKEAPVLP